MAASSTYNVEDQERMTSAKNYFAWQARLVKPALGRRVVEVGCGVGNFTRILLDREAVIAVDIEPRCIQRLQERFAGCANVHPVVCDVSSTDFSDLARFRADSCVALNVLEHVADDAGALRRMASVVAPGGHIVLLTPAFPSLYGPIDRNLGHHRRYSRGGIAKLARTAGLEPVKIHYVNAIGFFGWWANAHVWRREAQSAGQIRIFDRFVAPVSSRIESLVRPPFGQSLFVVLRRP
jgi:SAM-dependent methyltransferase